VDNFSSESRLHNLNLRHLEAFVAIAAAGNFTRAAAVLHISQPALTVQIRQLEENIGVKLLDRNTRTVKLTRIGQQLAPVIARVLRDIEAVLHDAHEMAAGVRGTVTVAALPSVCSTILPRIIAAFRQDHPGISVVLKDAVSPKVLAMVKSGEVDFGVGSFTDVDAGIQVTPLFTDHMKLVVPRDCPLARKRAIQLKHLVGLPLILMERESSVRMLVDRAFESIGHYPTPAYEATYMSSAVGMVRAGLGVAFLPSSTLEMSELSGLVARRVEHPGLTRRIVAARKSGAEPSPAAVNFLKVLVAGCTDLSQR
jgi:LysR family transcriptional regulator, carnitine catabolism transcriptional activator